MQDNIKYCEKMVSILKLIAGARDIPAIKIFIEGTSIIYQIETPKAERRNLIKYLHCAFSREQERITRKEKGKK